MDYVMEQLGALFKKSPEIALFLSLAIGFYLGKLKIGKFQLGGVAGSLLAAVVISQVGVDLGSSLKNVLFALFIYAVGYECGPQFFRSLNRESLKEILMALSMAFFGLLTVVILSNIFGLTKGLAAGVAAGGLTQSAIMGTANSTMEALGWSADKLKMEEADVAVGYAVTYIFGSFGTIIVCCNILPWWMRRSIRDDASAELARQHSQAGALGTGQDMAVHQLTGRVYRLNPGVNKTIKEIEDSGGEYPVAIEKLKRNKEIQNITPDFTVQPGDLILAVGRGEAVLTAMSSLGQEVLPDPDMELATVKREIVVANDKIDGKTLADIRDFGNKEARHGVFILSIEHLGQKKAVDLSATINKGDIITLYGSEQDINRVAPMVGYALVSNNKTDFVFLGFGLVVGLLIGLVIVPLGSLPLTLGSGGGALLAGLIFGWFRSHHLRIGAMPTSAVQLLKDLGLAGFVAIVGLSTGKQAIETIQAHGIVLFIVGVLVTIIPLLLCIAFGKYVLRYRNAAIMAGSLAGSRSANPAFGQILEQAGNSVPTIPFAITYALANVLLTLLGPLVISLVPEAAPAVDAAQDAVKNIPPPAN